jgi:hypothetical protein
LSEAWLYLWMGDCDQYWVRVVFPLFYIAGILMTGHGVAALTGRRWAGLAAAALPFFVPYAIAGTWNLFSGYADFPLGVLFVSALVYLLKFQKEGLRSDAILVSLVAGLLPWMKHEGMILWACLLLPMELELLKRKEFRLAWCAPIPGLAIRLGWSQAIHALHAVGTGDFLPVTISNLSSHLNRAATIVPAVLRELANVNDWSLLWLAMPLALGSLAARGHVKWSATLLWCIGVPLAFYGGLYLLSSWPSYMGHLHVSLARLVLQLAPAAVFAIGLACGADQRAQ